MYKSRPAFPSASLFVYGIPLHIDPFCSVYPFSRTFSTSLLFSQSMHKSPLVHRNYRYVLLNLLHEIFIQVRSEEHTSELQSRFDLVCRLLLEKKKNSKNMT